MLLLATGRHLSGLRLSPSPGRQRPVFASLLLLTPPPAAGQHVRWLIIHPSTIITGSTFLLLSCPHSDSTGSFLY